MKIYVKKDAGVEYRKYRMEMKDDEDVYDLMEKCRKDWAIDENTTILCSDEDGTVYDTDVKLSKLEGKVLIMIHNQPDRIEELTTAAAEKKKREDMQERLVSGFYNYLIQTKTSDAYRKSMKIKDNVFCLEVANYSARSLTSHIHEEYMGKAVDKQRVVMPGGVEGLLVTGDFHAMGSVSWLLGHGKMLVISYFHEGPRLDGSYLFLTVCRQCDNSDWVRKGVMGGDQPKCYPYDGTLPSIGHSVGSGGVAKNSEATLCLKDDQDYVVTAKVQVDDKLKMFAEVRVYPRQGEMWEEHSAVMPLYF